ncbi:DNA-binding CsgD family transcriptional regulator/GAF domain-containing protein [Paenibacillus phyllosphaerae]|uniref:DNA-binding CsgD family transcriptional regulator/GAF domain-containing protein n=1 Tax=Paenibacillus phyllosphaerae TaxID=274593 RepID=A0A7W5AU14_9BACL|nr:LuxR C-terminal-related transcriptional regulator [Paenibacillus phyllosphaerae]MBB3108653.1 DNA-binding CsgD family transcriptional regulator/GAF domain-containing protein [Paenibacillus phyllosphaerae]
MSAVPGYQLNQLIFEDDYIRVCHARHEQTGAEVLLKMVKDSQRAMIENAKLMNEYEIAGSLHIPGILKPLSLLRQGNGLILASEWIHGLTLRHFCQSEQLSIPQFLHIAIALARLLEQLHKQHVVHMNIRPDTVIVIPSSMKVYLTGMGHSIIADGSGTNARTMPLIEGSPPYMAPERTGRMNQPISGATDLYALGVTLYEMLTGRLPFEAHDPLEWAHAHVAKLPRPLEEAGRNIPHIISRIVLKLLEKSTAQRYQSAYGLRADLEQCWSSWEKTGAWEEFGLGEHERLQTIEHDPSSGTAAKPLPATVASNAAIDPSGFDYAHMLDLAAVMRASQAFSQEKDTSSLIARLMRILMELAGADRCCYIGIRPEGLVIEHVLGMGGDAFESPGTMLSDYEPISQEVVGYALVKQGPVLMKEAAAEGMFATDPYIARTGMKSMLCMPVEIQEQWQALLYLENRVLGSVFEPERIGVLRTLASQIHVVQQLHAHFGMAQTAIQGTPANAPSSALVSPLTEREREVLQGMAEGLTTKEIATQLVMSPETVKVHTRHIFEKLQVNNRVKAVTTAVKLNLLPAP